MTFPANVYFLPAKGLRSLLEDHCYMQQRVFMTKIM